MQLDDLAARIVPLPGPPLWEKYLLESPLALVAALAVGGVALFFILNARGKLREGALAGGVVLVLAVGVWILATAVVTPRERLIARARELIGVTADADVDALRPMIAERAEVRVGRDNTWAPGREAILRAVEAYPGTQYRVDAHSIAEAQGVIDGPNSARTQIRVKHSGPSLPPASWWRILWWRESPGSPWIVEAIEPLWISGYGNIEEVRAPSAGRGP